MKAWAAVVALSLSGTAFADTGTSDPSSPSVPVPDAATRAYVEHLQSLYANPDPSSLPDSVKKMMSAVQGAGQAALQPQSSQPKPNANAQEGQGPSRNALQERTQALTELGISPKDTGYVTVLVSSSMPRELLRAYAEQAVWVGGVLVFQGIDPDHDMKWFFKEVLMPLVKTNHSPAITIDPRPFGAYGVKAVPAIVYSSTPNDRICSKEITKNIESQGKHFQIRECAPVSSKNYWKITGSVTLSYALERFDAAGAPGAGVLATALTGDTYFGKSTATQPLSEDAYKKATGPSDLHEVLKMIHAPDLWNSADPTSLNSIPGVHP